MVWQADGVCRVDADKVPPLIRCGMVFRPLFASLPGFAGGFCAGKICWSPRSAGGGGLIGGSITAGTHLRGGQPLGVWLHTEPFSNWLASFGEEGMVLGGVWAMLASPILFLACWRCFWCWLVLC